MIEPGPFQPLRAWPVQGVRGTFRHRQTDFQVEECLQPGPESGEHLWLWLEKCGQNTAWVGSELARWAGVQPRQVGWAGLKDRHAVTRQWFSIHLPGRPAPAHPPDIAGVRVLGQCRQPVKLRPGMHAGNRFTLCLRHLRGGRVELEQRLQRLRDEGMPNAYGRQRFGHQGHNLWHLQRRFERGRPGKRDGRMISTARAWLFNRQLADALADGNWQAGTGWLWGRFHRDHRFSQGELRLRAQHPQLCRWLESLGMNAEPRPFRVLPGQMRWTWLQEDSLQLDFRLPPGAYATVLLDQLGEFRDARAGTGPADDRPTGQDDGRG